MVNEKTLVTQCLQNNASSQQKLYKLYSPRMYGICLRFARYQEEANDILQEGFIRVFNKLYTFKHKGSLEGWIRRIIVTTAINYVNKYSDYKKEIEIENIGDEETIEADAISKLAIEEIINLIQELPSSKRTIFNLYVYEGYSHKEIGKMLNIEESTSKGQLSKAKKILQEKITKLEGKVYARPQ